MRAIAASLVLILAGGVVLWTSLRNPPDRVWDVVLMGLPNSLSPKDIEVAPVGYLLNQTHRPLFKRNEDGLYKSEVLSTWVQDRVGRSIQLCPRSKIFIRSSIPFDAEKLALFLRARLPEVGLNADVKLQKECVSLLFHGPDQDFFELFTKFENAPTWKFGENPFEAGLGDFFVSKNSPDRIELLRNPGAADGFNKIVVHAYEGKAQFDALIKGGGIEDINRVSPDLVPNDIKETYADYGVVLLHTGVLVINVRDRELRRAIYNCLDIKDFRKAFSPGQEYFKSVQTILPIGAPGAREGLPPQRCAGISNAKKAPVKFWNWKDNNRETMKTFWKDFKVSTGIEITYSDIPLEKLMAIVRREEKGHELLVIGLSATEFHYRDFYQYLVNPMHSILTNVKLDLSRDLEKLDANPSESELIAGLKKIDDVLAKDALVLPLFQQTRHFYFPKRIKGLSFGSNFLEHPIVAEINN